MADRVLNYDSVTELTIFDLEAEQGDGHQQFSFVRPDEVCFTAAEHQSTINHCLCPNLGHQQPPWFGSLMANDAGASQPWLPPFTSWGTQTSPGPFTRGTQPYTTIFPQEDVQDGFNWSPSSFPNDASASVASIAMSRLSEPVDIPRHAPYNVRVGFLSPTDTNDTFGSSQPRWDNSWDSFNSFITSPTDSFAGSLNSFISPHEMQLAAIPEQNAQMHDRTSRIAVETLQEPAESLGTSPFAVVGTRLQGGSDDSAKPSDFRGQRRRGRHGPFAVEKKRQVALVRKAGACASCHDRKCKCDLGFACKQCINYHKEKLLLYPCRDKHLAGLADEFLKGHIFPRLRDSHRDFGPQCQIWEDRQFVLFLSLGFGEPMPWTAQLVEPSSRAFLSHKHEVYNWPKDHSYPSERRTMQHLVFPAILINTEGLSAAVDKHLNKIIDDPASPRHFPLYKSPLKVLQHIWDFYHALGTRSKEEKQAKLLLRQVFKLLNIIHIAGDTRVTSSPDSDLILQHLLPGAHVHETIPCLIRGQVGQTYRILARAQMREVLRTLEIECLRKEPRRFPLVLATFVVLFMAIESIQYHTHKTCFHIDLDHDGRDTSPALTEDELESIAGLLKFYENTFGTFHAEHILHADKAGVLALPDASYQNGERLLADIREAVRKSNAYLRRRSGESLADTGDIAVFFDRLVARLLLLETDAVQEV